MAQQYIGTALWGVTNNIAYTGSVGTIAVAPASGVTKVRLLSTTDCYVTLDGSTPSSTNGAYLVGLNAEYVTIRGAQIAKAVQVSSSGTIYVTDCL